MHTLITDPDYVALPKLVEKGEKFDFIFIDGVHSFDYVFLDFFYADLLLKAGGMIGFHDSSIQGVYKVCRFIANNKCYKIIGPDPEPILNSFIEKLFRRLKYAISGKNKMFYDRRFKWCSLVVFQKI